MRGVSVLLLLLLACGSSDTAAPDATASFDAAAVDDAAISDSGPADAFDPCPGDTTFEVGAVDWVTGNTLPGVLVQQADTANMASSAPNGRVVLCVTGDGALQTNFSKTDYAERIHTTSIEAVAAVYATGQAPTFRMITPAALNDLYTAVAATPSNTGTTFIAMVTDATTGMPLSGATVSIAGAHEGAYTPDGAGLAAGNVTGNDGKVIFMNAPRGSGTTTITVTGPSNCEIPETAAVTSEISSVAIACQP